MFRKNSQENAQKKTKRKSLTKSMQRLVLIVALVILVTASILNLIASRIQFASMFEINSVQMINSMKAVMGMLGGFDEYARDVLETWESIPEKIREKPESPEYRAYFEQYETCDFVKNAAEALEKLQFSLSMGDMYFAAVDQESGRMIYLLDPDGVFSYWHYPVGWWEQMTDQHVKELVSGEEGYGYYTKQSDDAITLREYGMRMQDDVGPYCILAMYDFPTVISVVTTALFAVAYIVILSILIVVIILITRRKIKNRLVRPINSIMSAAETYVEKKKNGEGAAGCFADLDIHTRDELEELGDVMAHMEKDIGIYEKDLADVAAKQAAMRTELSVATGIQAHMLPDAEAAFPDRSDFSIYASMNPAREVGGDFYDFFLIDEDHLGLTIADVSGKGIPAALFMMSSMIIINNYATLGFSPKEVLEKANTRICNSNVLDMFVTVWFGILDLKTGEVKAANAGHEYPVYGNLEKGFELIHDKHGLVIGAMEGTRYREYSFQLERGDTLYLYTDGVAEATNDREELYGTERLISVLNGKKDSGVKEICVSVKEDIDRFVQDAPQFDDITMLCIRYHGR